MGNAASAHAKVAEVSSTSTAVASSRPEPPVAVKTSPQAAKSPGHKEEMQKQVRQTKDRMKLQQESLAHKRKAMGLRREGKADEADAEYELAKALEKQMEEWMIFSTLSC
jgi:predicted RNA polymerase sigma factor